MKTRMSVCSVFLSVAITAPAGDLNVIGNVNVASNFVARSVELAGSGYYTYKLGLKTNGWGGLVISDCLSCDPHPQLRIFTPGSIVMLHAFGDEYDSENPVPLLLNPSGGSVVINSFESEAYDGLFVGGNTWIEGKLYVDGGMDPPYVLLDSETRDSIANRVAREVPPTKQTGAALFWNAKSKQLEIYVASESAFYSLAGAPLGSIRPPTAPDATVIKSYRVDPATGAVIPRETVQTPRWRVKPGYGFNSKTGTFTRIENGTNAIPATAQEALELK